MSQGWVTISRSNCKRQNLRLDRRIMAGFSTPPHHVLLTNLFPKPQLPSIFLNSTLSCKRHTQETLQAFGLGLEPLIVAAVSSAFLCQILDRPVLTLNLVA